MSKRDRSAWQSRSGLVALAVAAIVAVLLLVLAVRLIPGTLNLARSGGSGAPDPQFAEPAEAVTRPPELAGEGAPAQAEDDPSVHWEAAELTPVDKTAEQLGREEAAED